MSASLMVWLGGFFCGFGVGLLVAVAIKIPGERKTQAEMRAALLALREIVKTASKPNRY
jgi:F0F1-type ATP synthase membrane subunit c/vacuolar-type H+-ATPase subunit K